MCVADCVAFRGLVDPKGWPYVVSDSSVRLDNSFVNYGNMHIYLHLPVHISTSGTPRFPPEM